MVKIAVAGLGFMGSTHVLALRGVQGAELYAVVSGDERKLSGDLSAIQGNLGGPAGQMDFSNVRKYRSLDQALLDPEIDAVDLCLPTDQHAPATLASLQAGKHVLVEKPLALDGKTADALIREAEDRGRILMTGQVLRFFGSYRAAAELTKNGTLGKVCSGVFRRRCAAPAWSAWLADASRSGGGVFDLLIHDVDYCILLFGRPEAVSAFGCENLPRGIDFIAARLHYPGGEQVLITGGWHNAGAFPFEMEFTIVAEQGTLDYSSSDRPLTLYKNSSDAERPEIDTRDGFEAELQYFADCVKSGSKPLLCPTQDSADAVRVTRYMLESRARNGEKIACAYSGI